MFDLTGKAAIVTGASGGIGGAIAKALHKQGAVVTLSGTRADALERDDQQPARGEADGGGEDEQDCEQQVGHGSPSRRTRRPGFPARRTAV